MFPKQEQKINPGLEYMMKPRPISHNLDYKASARLQDKIVLITGGDSGIGRAIAYLFAKEGAHIAIAYLCETKDALETKETIESFGRRCLLIETDLKEENNCQMAIKKVIDTYGKLDVLVNNHGVQFKQADVLDISQIRIEQIYKTNVFSYIYLVKAALPYLKEYASIIHTTSVTAYQGSLNIDYSSTKGAIVSLTKSLSLLLEKKKIRVNAVAPGPVWTAFIPSTYSEEEVETFGSYTSETPMQRAAQPFEIAPSYLFLASDDSRYMSGQVLHPNGGTII